MNRLNQTAEGLTGNHKKAFEELVKLGAPVVNPNGNGYNQYTHQNCQFVMSSEENNSDLFLDYYGRDGWREYNYSNEVADILDKYGLFGEWANTAVLTICED